MESHHGGQEVRVRSLARAGVAPRCVRSGGTTPEPASGQEVRVGGGGAGLGFTLIELLIVVAIIGILAAIAIPNFMEAQTRAKVAKVQADHRTLDLAINLYYIDNNAYMPYDTWGNHGDPAYLCALTTPVAYVTSGISLDDPFFDPEIIRPFTHYGYYAATPDDDGLIDHAWLEIVANLKFFGVRGADGYRYCFTSAGPNRILEVDDWKDEFYPLFYDTSNGTISIGDVLRFGP